MRRRRRLILVFLMGVATASASSASDVDMARAGVSPENKPHYPAITTRSWQSLDQVPGQSVNAIDDRTMPDAVQEPIPEVATAWWTAVQEDIRQSEYEVTWQEDTYVPDIGPAYQAPNRANNLRTYFTAEGPVIIPRVWPEQQENPPWRWGLRLDAWGREGQLLPLGTADLEVKEDRIEYSRGGLSEWYVNGRAGLKQGVQLLGAPARDPVSQSPVVVRLAASGTLIPEVADASDHLRLTTPDGRPALEYAGVSAIDAAGRLLPTEVTATGTAVTISVDDTDASYPVILEYAITGLSTTADWTAEGDQERASFGFSVSGAGDVNGDGYSDVIVGAPEYNGTETRRGRVYVYLGSTTGLNTAPSWIVEGTQGAEMLGFSVSGAGDVNGDGYSDVIVGAPGYEGDERRQGKAYLYLGSSAGLSWEPAWEAVGGEEDAKLGSAVSTAGDVNGDGLSDVIVAGDSGQAYVYHGTSTGLTSAPTWTMGGEAVSTAGDVNGDGYSDVIVGGWYSLNGRAYVYFGSSEGLSTASSWMAEGSASDNDTFGFSVAGAGDVNGDGYGEVVVGARFAGSNRAGRAYVYLGSPTGPQAQPSWVVDGEEWSSFGFSVSTAGDIDGDGYADVIIGASSASTNAGQASVYLGSQQGLSGSPSWTAEGIYSYTHFGRDVATAGDVNGDGYSDIIVGASGYSSAEYYNEGQALVYHGSPAAISSQAGWQSTSGQVDASLGSSVATSGDVNADGFADIIIGVPGYDGGEIDEGRAYVYHGAGVGLSTVPNWTIESNTASAYLGHSVATAGDVNSDGYADLVVGAHGEDRVYVYHGGAAGVTTDSANWTGDCDQLGAHFGFSVATAGDVNGDGYADIVVGAPYYDIPGTATMTEGGRAYVYIGGPSGLHSTALIIDGEQVSAHLGHSVGTAGDVNADGYSDVIVGSPDYDGVEADQGRVYVYHGSADGLAYESPGWTVQGDQPAAGFGISVGSAGDVNGDGYADVIIGAPHYAGEEVGEGRAYGYHGSGSGLSVSADWEAGSDKGGAQFGASVGTAGDVNGDGYADVIVGAPFYDPYDIGERGAAFAYVGSATGLSYSPDWQVVSAQTGARLGASVAAAGDVNGDGFADLVIGAPGYDGDQIDEGRALVYYGNGGPGLAIIPRQMSTYGARAISPLGKSDMPTMMQLQVRGRMPLGREKVRLEWQVAPLGTHFTSTTGVISGTSTDWTEIYPTGTVISQTVKGLMPETPHHWRARFLYQPGNIMLQPASRWFHIPWNSWTEQDFRTPAYQAMTDLSAVNSGPTPLGSATVLTATPTLTNPSQAVYVSYAWDFGDGSPILTTGNPVTSHIYHDLGTYHATVTATNPVNVLTAATGVTVVDAPIDGLSASNDSPTALGESTLLSATVAAGTNVSYAWDLGDGHSASGPNVEHDYPLGVHLAVVTATNSVSSVSDTTTVTVEESIEGLSVVSDSPTLLGDSTALTATITAGSDVSYHWEFDYGESVSGASVSHTFPDPGTHSATVTALNRVSVATATTSVDVIAPIVGLTAMNDSPTPLGRPTTLRATLESDPDASYAWDFGDGTGGIGATVLHVYPSIGSFTAIVTASTSLQTVTASTVVDVMSTTYLPLIMRRWPPIPQIPVLEPIYNPGQDGSYTVTWREADLADTYVLEQATTSTFSDPQVVYDGPGLYWSVPDPGNMPGTYYYRVKAHTSWGDSAWSNVVQTTVSSLPPTATPEPTATPVPCYAYVRGVYPSGFDYRIDVVGAAYDVEVRVRWTDCADGEWFERLYVIPVLRKGFTEYIWVSSYGCGDVVAWVDDYRCP